MNFQQFKCRCSAISKIMLCLLTISLLGGLKRDDKPQCRGVMLFKYYKNGKEVFEQTKSNTTYFSRITQGYTDLNTNKSYKIDSIVIKVIQ